MKIIVIDNMGFRVRSEKLIIKLIEKLEKQTLSDPSKHLSHV